MMTLTGNIPSNIIGAFVDNVRHLNVNRILKLVILFITSSIYSLSLFGYQISLLKNLPLVYYHKHVLLTEKCIFIFSLNLFYNNELNEIHH